MNWKSRHWLWLLLLAPVGFGLARLRLDVEVLDLLPPDARAVQGLKLYQQHFANARELIVTVQAPVPDAAESAARRLAEALRRETNLVAEVTWQPPWLEHPAQAAELPAYLWFNQPPELFRTLNRRLNPESAAALFAAAREQLATSLSPAEIARLSYDPLGLTQLPESVAGSAPGFARGREMFASADGTFRICFVQARSDLATYRQCTDWLAAVRRIVNGAVPPAEQAAGGLAFGYTGRPAFVSEISRGMEWDMKTSVGATSLIIAALFWVAHRRWKPMLWLLALLALVLLGTLGLGGLLFGRINVVSLGFAAILLGLAVDYAVVHYQEARAHPDLSVPEIRRAIAPSICWAAVTTIAAFLSLNLGGLPGLAQLGSLVALGMALAALVMVFAFLPPLFPDRRQPGTRARATPPPAIVPPRPVQLKLSFGLTLLLLAGSLAVLVFGLPRMDATATALRPARSPAYAALTEIQQRLGEQREPWWLIVAGRDEAEVGRRLAAVESTLEGAVSNQLISTFTLPTPLWPQPGHQAANRAEARALSARGPALREAARAGGFAPGALALTEGMLNTWESAASSAGVFWPTNDMSRWILAKISARSPANLHALGLVYPATNSPAAASVAALEPQLAGDHAWLSGWGLLGGEIFSIVKRNLWRLLVPMVGLVLMSLWQAFRRLREVLLSVVTLALSGLCLLAIMRMAGWSWNLLNLMAMPLILGTGVDYSIFTQLALRRHHGDLAMTYRSVGRALLLCGGTAVAGFSSLAWSSNAGMASLGKVCAVGIAGNMIIAVFLLPAWWHALMRRRSIVEGRATEEPAPGGAPSAPSALYRAGFWRAALVVARILPRSWCSLVSRALAKAYWFIAAHRREVVVQNLLPALNNDRAAAEAKAAAVFRQFALKLVDLWRFEAGLPIQEQFGTSTGWEHFDRARSERRGVLLLTLHLGNWEFGGPWLAQKGVPLQVITRAEPGEAFTRLRRASRTRWNIETVVIGNDAFEFVEIIRRLDAGATVALLIDRPPPATAVTVNLFGRPMAASVAAAELARATGCVLLPACLPRVGDKYDAHILPAIDYDRAALRDRESRRRLTQEIVRALEPSLCQHLDQWYHFVPVWPPL